MVNFDNVNLEHQNVALGPDAGRIYSIDHETDTMIIKTNPGGGLVATIPLDFSIQNEVRTFQYDGFYWWTQSAIGLNSDLGIIIQKWKLENNILKKQLGPANEIILSNIASVIYDSEAMVIDTHETVFTGVTSSGSTSIPIGSTTFLQAGDDIYLGPSTVGLGERERHKVSAVVGNTVTLTYPTEVTFNLGDLVTYRKDIWLFNNYNFLDPNSGSLIQIDGYTGYVIGTISSAEWQHITAADSSNGILSFIRGSQYLEYKPFGINAGYQTSLLLNNIDNSKDFIKVYDIVIDATSVHKLQTKLHYFEIGTGDFEDIHSLNNNYNLDQEFFTSSVKSLSVIREDSIFFGDGVSESFIVEILDQYNIPVFSRAIAISEDDPSGIIEPGYESFTSDLNGQGITKYNSGLNPDFNVVEVQAQDVSTGYNLRFNLLQLPFLESNSTIIQLADIFNSFYITQFETSADLLIDQRPALDSILTIIQRLAPSERINIIQYFYEYFTLVTQKTPLFSESLVTQLARLSDTTIINQYDFLIFAIPTPYSIKNSADTDILVRITGFGAIALDSSTLVFKVNGINVSSQVQISPFAGGLELSYNPTEDFPYSSVVSVYIQIQDVDAPPNIVSTYYTFDIVPDTKKPYLYEVFPPDQSAQNSATTEIYGIIKDLETGINLDTVEMFVEGKLVNHTSTVIDSNTIKVAYTPTCEFPFLSTIAVAISASDNEGNKFVGSWSFTVQSSSGVLFTTIDPENCDVLVPISTDICTEVFGLSEGVNIKTLTFDVNGKLINYLLKPKVYRKE